MRSPKVFSMPWDMVVFLSITGVGFGFSMQKLKPFEVQEPQPNQSSVVRGSFEQDTSSQSGTLLDLGCVEQKLSREKVTSHLGQIRVKGRFCSLSTKAMRNFGGVSVKNLTTGKEGTIFLRGLESVFVTDALSLTTGRNEIRIEWKAEPDAAAKELIAEIYEK